MKEKILFMIYNGEIKFMKSDSADYWKWYQSLGGDPNGYDSVIRGFITNGNIVYFKTNYAYDDEVVDTAKEYSPLIKQHLQLEKLNVFCGLEKGDNGALKPKRAITEEEIANHKYMKEKAEQERIEREQYEAQLKILQERSTKDDLLEFKNDYQDEDFTKYAVTFTVVLLIATLISKILLIAARKLYLGNRWNSLIVFLQIASLGASIYFYKKKSTNAKMASLAATVFLFFTFTLPDIIIAAFNLFFTVDQKYIIDFMAYVDKAKNKSEEELGKIKDKSEEELGKIKETSKKEIKKMKRKRLLAKREKERENIDEVTTQTAIDPRKCVSKKVVNNTMHISAPKKKKIVKRTSLKNRNVRNRNARNRKAVRKKSHR